MSTILVVDDDATLLTTFEAILRLAAHKVIVAWSGENALDMMRNDRLQPDLILADLRMPEMSGLEWLAVSRDFLPLAQ